MCCPVGAEVGWTGLGLVFILQKIPVGVRGVVGDCRRRISASILSHLNDYL